MADEETIQPLLFNFGRRTFAHKRHAQDFYRTFSASTSLVRENLHPIVKADRYVQYVDEILVAAYTTHKLNQSFDSSSSALIAQVSMSQWTCAHLGVLILNFQERRSAVKTLAPSNMKQKHSVKKQKLPTSAKSLQRYIGFVNFYRQYIPNLAGKLNPVYKLLENDISFELNDTIHDSMFKITQNLARAAKLSLPLPLPTSN